MTQADRVYRYLESLLPDGATDRDVATWLGWADIPSANQECRLLEMRGKVRRVTEAGRGVGGRHATVNYARGRQALVEEIARHAGLRFPFTTDTETWRRIAAFVLACADDERARPGQNHYWWMKPPPGYSGHDGVPVYKEAE